MEKSIYGLGCKAVKQQIYFNSYPIISYLAPGIDSLIIRNGDVDLTGSIIILSACTYTEVNLY